MSRPTLGAYTTSHSTCTGVLSRGQSGRDVMLTTHHHLQTRSRTSLPIIPPSQHAFKERTGNLYLYLLHRSKRPSSAL